MGKSNEIIVDSKQSKNKESSETKKGKKSKVDISEPESVTVVESKKETSTETKKGKKDKVDVIEEESVIETKKNKKDSSLSKNIIEDNILNNDSNILDTIIPKSSAITNPEFIILKNKWYELTKKIENLNNERDILELEKNNFVSEMCKIIEKHQPKVDNLLEQKTVTIGKATISSKLLETDSDDSSDSSDSDDEVPIKKKTTTKKLLVESSDDDSDSD